MQAKDIMTTQVASVRADTSVVEIARLLVKRRISAVPVVDGADRVIGIVSEGDLMRREEIGTEPPRHSWWLRHFGNPENLAAEYAKVHGLTAKDIMTSDVIVASDDTAIGDIAEILDTRHIKRVPILRDGRLVGIVSRANIVQGLAVATEISTVQTKGNDEVIRTEILDLLHDAPWASPGTTNVIVSEGVVGFWGTAGSDAELDATRIAAERIAGVRSVEDHRSVGPTVPGAGL